VNTFYVAGVLFFLLRSAAKRWLSGWKTTSKSLRLARRAFYSLVEHLSTGPAF